MGNPNYLCIPDLHEPYANSRALSHCVKLKKTFKVSDENVYFLGDETDQYFASKYPKDIDAPITANQEIEYARKKLRGWYRHFPIAKVCNSNHQQRWFKRFFECQIPSQLMRSYRELIEAPPGWEWADKFLVKAQRPFMVQHGTGYSGKDAARNCAMNNGVSTIIGHIHAFAGISYIKTNGMDIFGANAGCLIDPDAYCFAYSREDKFKPSLGALVILDGGRIPLWVPL